MTNFLILQAAIRLACPFLLVLFATAVKNSILLAFVFGATWVTKDASAKLRHVLWLSCIGSCLLVLILSFTGPLFHFALPQPHRGALVAVSSALFPASGTFDVSVGMPAFAGEMWRRVSLGRLWIDAWPAVLLFLWISGALSGWLSVLWGRLQLWYIRRTGHRDGTMHYESQVRNLSRSIGIRREVRVFESTRCTTPFTHGIIRPVIVLPSRIRSWSSASRRSVLLHELRHIKRGDSFTLIVAYGICSLFWFVPHVWAAYARLYMEQEKSCDAAVVESGVQRDTYAACVLDAALLSREPALLAGLSFSGRRKRVLQDRIQSIINGKKPMKSSIVPFCLAALLIGVIAVSSASGIETISQGEKKFGKLYLREYRAKTTDERAILDTLMQYETAFNSHDSQKLVSLFANEGSYRPCGASRKYSIGSRDCLERIKDNFIFFKFEIFYDPLITIHGDKAAVKLLLESGDYLADYSFVLKRKGRNWLVSEADYSNEHVKG